MKRIIGVDIDAVLTDEGRGTENIWYKNLCAYFNLDGRVSNSYDFRDAYGLSTEEVEDFINKKGLEIFETVPPRPKCKEVLTRLKAKGYQIILVTARPEENNQVTLEWLSKHEIPFDKLYHSDEKINICKKEEIEFFIDDNPEHLLPMMKALEIPVFLMNMDHNQDHKIDFNRVDNWTDIEEKILDYFE
ncbi:hypothetical protein BX659_102184 [Orenia metallireducens]|uniref:Nucleotidase n=1 Tax=Orenia metallireducens TaxID=1413210 RepID=A0A285F6W6_9FIRM|nr:hypothetical protein [Orenia metallireducens]PRX34867.1 hypothetical protein BX659_102184 [Orenia metallireducens]SNY05951.1 hypothetical protein SAMN06265827_101184 [Orenia metallireducens]